MKTTIRFEIGADAAGGNANLPTDTLETDLEHIHSVYGIDPESLNFGDVMATRWRKVTKWSGNQPSGDLAQVEFISRLNDPNRSAESALSALMGDDERFIGSEFKMGWNTATPTRIKQIFYPKMSQEAFDALWDSLTNSTSLHRAAQVEATEENMAAGDVHFVKLNILNPAWKGKNFKIEVFETTTKPSAGAIAKINPGRFDENGNPEPVTHKGLPIYQDHKILWVDKHYKLNHTYLASDSLLPEGEKEDQTAPPSRRELLNKDQQAIRDAKRADNEAINKEAVERRTEQVA